MESSTIPMPWVSPQGEPGSSSPLVTLDQRIVQRASGLVIVDGPESERAAVFEHVIRRAALAGRSCVGVDGTGVVEPWREVGRQLGLQTARDAHNFARSLGRALDDAVLVVSTRGVTHWGSALVESLAEQDLAALVIVLGTYRVHGPRLILDHVASREDATSYYEALTAHGRTAALSQPGLGGIAHWWRTAPLAAVPAPSPSHPDELRTEAEHDAWAAMAGAELLAGQTGSQTGPQAGSQAGPQTGPQTGPDGERHADACVWAWRAIELAPDAAARADLWERFSAALLPRLTEDDAIAFAELALEQGDGEQALELIARCPVEDSFRTALVAGRASASRGDVERAALALGRAVDLSGDDHQRAEATVALGELRLAGGDREAARDLAEDALDREPDETVRLAARNLLGKVIIAEGRWAEAESHFLRDEEMAAASDRRADVLRARVNRAIAVMSQQRRLEARTLLESVLEDGDALGERRAIAFALGNLAVLHSLGHDYATALALFERCLGVVRALGDAFRLAHNTFNLAHLRLRVGMVDEAEQTLAFGRRACGPNLADNIAALMSFVAAEAKLARGDTLAAAQAADEAIAASRRSNNGGKLGEALRLGARIALAEGDVLRARRYLAQSETAPGVAGGEAEQVVLQATVARAAGEPYRAQAEEATRKAEDELEFAREAHCLAGFAALDEDDAAAARHHLDAARSNRDRIAASLPEAMRQSFHARADLAELTQLEARLNHLAEAPGPTRGRPTPASRVRASRHELVGDSPAMDALRAAINKLGPSEATVLIAGESGTGKELVADALHRASDRHDGPIVKVNCAALVETLLLSELFGHERGAFTGAQSRKQGLFEHAHGGTIFLDEIGDVSPKTQVALLRVLQERCFERVGGCESLDVDVRVICATHRNLPEMVATGTFREDLYYRLCGVTLEVPALRERPADLPALAEALLTRISDEQRSPKKRLTTEAAGILERHRWPGNVRELENALRAAALFAEGELITARDLSDNVDALREVGPPQSLRPSENPSELVYASIRTAGTSLPDMKKALERACIERALKETDGNITRAAKLLGMKRPRVSQLVNQFARDDQKEVTS